MGKLFFEFGLPVFAAIYLALHLARYWYLKYFPKRIKNYKDIVKASKTYERKLK